MTEPEGRSRGSHKCKGCGSRVFLVDETCTHLEIDGEIVRTYMGDLTNRNCIRCTYPDLYPDYRDYDDGQRVATQHVKHGVP